MLFHIGTKILQSFVFFKCGDGKASQHHETASPKNQNAVSLGQVSPTAWPFLLAGVENTEDGVRLIRKRR